MDVFAISDESIKAITMYYFFILFMILAGVIGLYLGVAGYREYTHITRTTEKVSVLQIIKIATCFGLAGSLCFFTVISTASIFDPEYAWTLENLTSIVLVSLIPGIIITLGSIYQIYTTVLFRDMLIKKYKEKDKPENHNS